jgi:hypothetical protein
MVLILGVSILFIPVKAASYQVTISLEKNDEVLWQKTYWVEVNGKNATLLIQQWIYDKFFELFTNRTLVTPFTLLIVETNTSTRTSLYVRSYPSGLQVIFKSAYPGDVNLDGKVEYYDLYLFGLAWLSKKGEPNYNPSADFNFDGVIYVDDLDMFGRNWLKGT